MKDKYFPFVFFRVVTLSDLIMKGYSDFPLFSSGEVTPFGFVKKG
jgi:hypothetical protein